MAGFASDGGPAQLSPGEFSTWCALRWSRTGRRSCHRQSQWLHECMPEERFLLIQLHELQSYLGRQGVTTFCGGAARTVGKRRHGAIDASYLADSCAVPVFELEGTLRKVVSVLKKRSGRHEDTIRELKLNAQGIELSEPLAQLHGYWRDCRPDPQRMHLRWVPRSGLTGRNCTTCKAACWCSRDPARCRGHTHTVRARRGCGDHLLRCRRIAAGNEARPARYADRGSLALPTLRAVLADCTISQLVGPACGHADARGLTSRATDRVLATLSNVTLLERPAPMRSVVSA